MSSGDRNKTEDRQKSSEIKQNEKSYKDKMKEKIDVRSNGSIKSPRIEVKTEDNSGDDDKFLS